MPSDQGNGERAVAPPYHLDEPLPIEAQVYPERVRIKLHSGLNGECDLIHVPPKALMQPGFLIPILLERMATVELREPPR